MTLPLLVFLAAPASGHMLPVLRIAREMVQRGYGAIFMATSDIRASVEKAGVEFWEQPALLVPELMAERSKQPQGVEMLVFDFEKFWLPSFRPRHENLKALLEMVREREPDRPVVIVTEVMAMAVAPFLWGAPLPRGYSSFPKTIGINVIPMLRSSIDTAPFGFGLPPDSTESGRARNRVLLQLASMPFADVQQKYIDLLKTMGCQPPAWNTLFDSFIDPYETTFQLCGPSFEYPRTDLPLSIRFTGTLPTGGLPENIVYPEWWATDVIDAKASNKKIVAVTQGTIARNYDELIRPTVRALAGREDCLVVVILGARNAKLLLDESKADEDALPANVRVLDYFPYDAILAHADVLVSNGGYGGVGHAINHAVPLVASGITEDKIEVTARVAYSGLGVNLCTQSPTSEAIATGVDQVLSDPKFKARAERLRRESRDLDAFSIIEREIQLKAQEAY